MSDVYSDDYASVAGADRDGLVPVPVQRLAGAILFLLLIGAMGFWAYRLGTRDAAEVPVIRAMEGPLRVQPADPGGLQADHQGLEVNAVLAGDPAPAPEAAAPLAPPPAVLVEEDGPQGELVMLSPPRIAEGEPAEGQDLRMPPQDELVVLEEPAAAETAVDTEAAAVLAAVLGEPAATETAPLDATPDEAATMRPLRRPRNLVVARATSPAATSAATATPAPAQTAAPAPATTRPAAAPASAAVQAPATAAPASAREVRAVPAGARLIQLGAYDNEALTRQAWERLVARNGDLLGSKSLYVERTTANARVFYRLRVAGFTSADQTRVMCEQLRARGVDCIPVTLQ